MNGGSRSGPEAKRSFSQAKYNLVPLRRRSSAFLGAGRRKLECVHFPASLGIDDLAAFRMRDVCCERPLGQPASHGACPQLETKPQASGPVRRQGLGAEILPVKEILEVVPRDLGQRREPVPVHGRIAENGRYVGAAGSVCSAPRPVPGGCEREGPGRLLTEEPRQGGVKRVSGIRLPRASPAVTGRNPEIPARQGPLGERAQSERQPDEMKIRHCAGSPPSTG